MIKFNLKSVASGVALAIAAGAAHATMTDVTAAAPGDVLLVVYDASNANTATSGISYIEDLGITQSQLLAITSGTSQTFAGDSNFTAFLAADAAATKKISYGLVTVDTSGVGSIVSSAVSSTNTWSQVGTSTDLPNAYTALNTASSLPFVPTVGTNTLGTGAIGAQGSVVASGSATNANDQDYLFATGGFGSKFTGSTGATTALASTVLDVYQYNVPSTAFASGIHLGYLNFNATTGALVYTAGVQNPPVGAVPEPGTWALMVAGLLTVGAIARRRSAA